MEVVQALRCNVMQQAHRSNNHWSAKQIVGGQILHSQM